MRKSIRQDQPGTPQHRVVAPRVDRAGTRRQAPQPDDQHAGRADSHGPGEEPDGLRRVHRSRWSRRIAPHHGHELGPDQSSVGVAQGRRHDRSDDFGSGPRKRARVARAQATQPQPVGQRRGEIPCRQQGPRQGGERGSLRRVRATRGRRRGHGARVRVVVDEARGARVGCVEGRRRNRHAGAGDQARGAEDFPRHSPARSQPVVAGAEEVSAGHEDQRQGAEPHQFWRVCGDRGRHRRDGARVRHVVVAQGDQSRGVVEEGPDGGRGGAGSGQRQPADFARHEAD